jgi:ribonuclease III
MLRRLLISLRFFHTKSTPAVSENIKDVGDAFASNVFYVTGIKPKNIKLYELAFSHSSVNKKSFATKEDNSYERLEFLGDAILGAIIAEFLFKKYPNKDEGFMTEIRSRMVNREKLNEVAKSIGLQRMVIYHGSHRARLNLIYGDVLEALIGAIYMDKGYIEAQRFVLTKMVGMYYELEDIVNTNFNYKAILIQWSQRNNQKLDFIIAQEKGSNHDKEFFAEVHIGEEVKGSGRARTKKKAHQLAAERACVEMGLVVST